MVSADVPEVLVELRLLLPTTFKAPFKNKTNVKPKRRSPNYSFTKNKMHVGSLTNAFTWSDVLFDALDGGALSRGVKQQQQNGLQDSDHVIEG